MKLRIDVPKPVVKMLKKLLATGLYGRSLEECAFRLMGDALQPKLARGGLLHDSLHEEGQAK